VCICAKNIHSKPSFLASTEYAMCGFQEARFTKKWTRSTVFPPPIDRLLAWSTVTPPDDEFASVKNFWSVVCAVAASANDSCCKTNSTATRAKSSTSSVTVNVAVGLVVLLVLVVLAVVEAVVAALVGVVVVVVVVVVVAGAVVLVLSSPNVVRNIVEKEPVKVVGSVRVLITTAKVPVV
jgi:hypothetical protein